MPGTFDMQLPIHLGAAGIKHNGAWLFRHFKKLLLRHPPCLTMPSCFICYFQESLEIDRRVFDDCVAGEFNRFYRTDWSSWFRLAGEAQRQNCEASNKRNDSGDGSHG